MSNTTQTEQYYNAEDLNRLFEEAKFSKFEGGTVVFGDGTTLQADGTLIKKDGQTLRPVPDEKNYQNPD